MLLSNKQIVLLVSLSLFLGATVNSAEAEAVIRSGATVSIAEEQIIESDFYSAANIINISGIVKEDAVLTGGHVGINGSIEDDVFVLAARTEVHGTIGDDLRIISGDVVIAEPITGDLFVVGGSVNILSTASITGDVIIYARQATIEGSVGGDVIGTVKKLRLDAQVTGDVDVTVSELTLGDRANIAGSVRYVSSLELNKSLNSTVGGDLSRNDPDLPSKDMNIKSAMIPSLIIFFSTLVWYLLSRQTLAKVANRALNKSPRPLLLGLATLLFAPLAGLLLAVSLIGTMVGLAVIFGYFLIIILSFIATAAVFGLLLMRMFNRPSGDLTLISLLVGVIGVSLLMLLTFVGQLLLVGLVIITIGAMVDILIRPTIK